jgi:hypothetical protein
MTQLQQFVRTVANQDVVVPRSWRSPTSLDRLMSTTIRPHRNQEAVRAYAIMSPPAYASSHAPRAYFTRGNARGSVPAHRLLQHLTWAPPVPKEVTTNFTSRSFPTIQRPWTP